MYNAFFEFARKRHQIYLDRQAGLPAPWTDDPILQEYSFTNVFRELDKTTIWFRENVRERYYAAPQKTILMAVVVFRLFNRITTGEAIFNQQCMYDGADGKTPFEMFLATGDAFSMMGPIKMFCGKGPYCTGSYIINSPNGMDKLTGVLQMIQWVHDGHQDVLNDIREYGTLGVTWKAFTQFPHIAAFTSYEFVTDLRHTPLLNKAPDIMTWANPGPGAMRGLNRIHGRPLNTKGNRQRFIDEMQVILDMSLAHMYWPKDWPTLEMRDVEHTLCEFDKYERTRLGEGRPRGKFKSS